MYQDKLYESLDYHNYLDDSRWQAVLWIGENTDKDDTIAVSPKHLGWWVEGKDKRNVFYLEDRDMSPTTFEQSRSLITDRILSRNQGLENGNLRLATTYPYYNASGNSALGVYVGGFYQDVLIFADQQSYLEFEDGSTAQLAYAYNGESVEVSSTLGRYITSYQVNNIEITQTSTLKQGENKAAISYEINCHNIEVSRFEVTLLFSYEPASPPISDGATFEVTNMLNTS